MKIKKSAVPTKRVTWAGGNPRTEQRGQFIMYDSVTKTRHVLDSHTKAQEDRDRQTYLPDGSADRLNPDHQMGRSFVTSEFIAKLRLLNSSLIFQVTTADPALMGIYISHSGYNIRTAQSGTYLKLISGLPNVDANGGIIPEFSIMAPRMEDKPTADGKIQKSIQHAYERIRGWRTVLAKLYVAGLITEAQITTHFRPAIGRSSELWQRQIYSAITVSNKK